MSDQELRDKFREVSACLTARLKPRKPFIAGAVPIRLAEPLLIEESLLAAISTVLSAYDGALPPELGKVFGRALGRRTESLLVNSGSSANLAALSALRSKDLTRFGHEPLIDGDEVITVAACSPTLVAGIVHNRLLPVFIDVEEKTGNATFDAVSSARTARTRAVLLPHSFGNLFRADELAQWCKNENLFLIEDCRDALGAKLAGRAAGSFGVFSTFSFDAAKQLPLGSAGMLSPADARWGGVARSLRDSGSACWCEAGEANTCGRRYSWQLGELPEGYDHQCSYSHLGYNLRASELEAAVVLDALKALPTVVEARRANWRLISEGVKSSPVLSKACRPLEETPGGEASWLTFSLYLDASISRQSVIEKLREKHIETSVYYAGDIRRQPCFAGVPHRTHGELVNTAALLKQLVCLPVHQGLGEKEITYMLGELEAAVK